MKKEIIEIMNKNSIEEIYDEKKNLLLSKKEINLLNHDEDFIKKYEIRKEDEERIFSIYESDKMIQKIFLKYQIHEKKDENIKISESRKIEEFNLKIIYNRKRDNSLEYRIFISFYDENHKLIRNRMRNSEIDSISSDKEKMIKYFQKIRKEDILKFYES